MKRIVLILNIIICISSIIYVIYFFRQQSFNEVLAELQKIKGNYVFILSTTFCSNAIGLFALMLSFNHTIPGNKFFLFHVVNSAGDAVSRVTPTNIVIGDSYKVIHFSDLGIKKTNSASALIIYNGFCLLANIVFFCICVILYIFQGNKGHQSNINTVIVSILGLLIIASAAVIVIGKSKLASRLSQKIRTKVETKPKLEKIFEKVKEVFVTIQMTFYQNKSKFFLLIVLTAQKFGGVFELFFILSSLDIPTSVYSCMIFETGIIIMRFVFALIPMQLGIEEVWNKFLLDFIRISSPQTWLTVSIIRRSRMLIWILYGLFYLLALNTRKVIKEKHR